MEEKALAIKAAITGICAALTIIWGWFGWLIVALIVAMTIDYITGWIKARNMGMWKSSTAKRGIGKKVGIIAIIGVAGIVDAIIGTILTNIPGVVLPFTYGVLICPIVVIWYLLAELGSILENCKDLGIKEIPLLSKVINVLTKTIEKVGDKISPE